MNVHKSHRMSSVRRGWRRATVVAAVVILSTAMGASAVDAAPAKAPNGSAAVPADGHGPRGKANRPGHANPTAHQLSAAAKFGSVRWNELGTPSSIGPATLAGGLATDPVTAAREFLAQNRDTFGLDDAAVAAMD